MTEEEVIAERVIYAVDKDGRRFDIGLKIGRPYKRDDSGYESWACPVALIGLHRRLADIFGTDSWQALTLAMRFAKVLLSGFVEDGGRLFWDHEGDPITVDELFGETPPQPFTPDEPLTSEEQERVDRLTPEELAEIDETLLRECSHQFRKIARVAGRAWMELKGKIPNVPDTFYADRVRVFVAEGKLESQGPIEGMRYGEVRWKP